MEKLCIKGAGEPKGGLKARRYVREYQNRAEGAHTANRHPCFSEEAYFNAACPSVFVARPQTQTGMTRPNSGQKPAIDGVPGETGSINSRNNMCKFFESIVIGLLTMLRNWLK
jgi:hypothetical protein